MEDWTKDASKFNQMVSEASTALSLYRNIGSYTTKKRFPEGTTCLICTAPMDQAEHLINKAHGGNHTRYNVIPVCKTHSKPGKQEYNVVWWKAYSEENVAQIKRLTTDNEEDRKNPYHQQNVEDTDELKDAVAETINRFRTKKGLT